MTPVGRLLPVTVGGVVVPEQGAPGQRLSGLTIACGTGAVEITLAQREGKRPMAADDVLRGASLPDVLC